jgi:hypothetical protein
MAGLEFSDNFLIAGYRDPDSAALGGLNRYQLLVNDYAVLHAILVLTAASLEALMHLLRRFS